MVMQTWPEFTINFICHDEIEILRKTLPHNLAQLCAGTKRGYDVILTVDGVEAAPRDDFLRLAEAHGVDEVRLRRRRSNCASGDGANNGHLHAFSDKTRYLLTIEADIAFFRTDPDFDPLDAFVQFFDRHPKRPLIHQMDDHDCWVWKLEKAAKDVEAGVWSVNRVASHFLVYDTLGARQVKGFPDLGVYHDSQTAWFNFEDELSQIFAEPAGPGIAFPTDWPMRVYHCDRKLREGSAHYCKSADVKLEVFEQRVKEVAALTRRPAAE
ncbi:hypothetical protein [uncultured Roseobacter sp.]|uniref:hypothetical protein n=1 Tax=uncultured Roseobacter sp. TaxID=114847 RepID=UPI002613C43C|nr:hypothetical protein [uncultured Roseobacter sp.]